MCCRLLAEDMNLLIINEETKEDTRKNKIEKVEALHDKKITIHDLNTFALVIDGKSLGYTLEPDLEGC